MKNLFDLTELETNPLQEEFFEDLFTAKNTRVERIISEGHSSPKGFWYDQEVDEWVVLLQGSAEIMTLDENNEETLWELKPGDSLLLKAHQKHRVEKTCTNSKTIWLALHGNIDNGITE